MLVDISLLKNIDFKNTDNLIFLSIFLLIAIVIFIIFVVIVKKIIRMIKRLVARIFNIDVKKPKFDKKESTDWLHQTKEDENTDSTPKQRIVNSDIGNANISGRKPEVVQEHSVEKDIAEGLSKLKSDSSAGEGTLESKMPSRSEDAVSEEIKIPVPKRFLTNDVQFQPAGGFAAAQSKTSVVAGEHTAADMVQKISENKNRDSSIFGGKPEVSRIKLEHEMRTDAKVWQAAKQTGLNLSPVERSKLVKEVFSTALGRNISKTDLKSSVKKLNQKMLNTQNSAEHAKIRKEIKFFKKIGGIK